MKPLLALGLIALLAGCVTGPQLGAGVFIGPGGVHIAPSVSANIAGARVRVSP